MHDMVCIFVFYLCKYYYIFYHFCSYLSSHHYPHAYNLPLMQLITIYYCTGGEAILFQRGSSIPVHSCRQYCSGGSNIPLHWYQEIVQVIMSGFVSGEKTRFAITLLLINAQ